MRVEKASLYKVSFALAVISLYTYVFGVVQPVEVWTAAKADIGIADIEDFAEEQLESLTSPEAFLSGIEARPKPGYGDYDINVLPRENTDGGTDTVNAAVTTATTATTTAVTTTAAVTATAANQNNSGISNYPSESSGERFRITSTSSNSVVEGEAYDIVARVVQAEIGSSFHKEAIKAQAVAAYTYIKRQNAAGNAPTLPISGTASERVKECVDAVRGVAIYYGGEIIQAVFSASSAGYSKSAKNVWGDDLPYLQSVRNEFDDIHDPNKGRVISFPSSEIAANVLKQTGIQLIGDPSGWITIDSHVDNVYVGRMTIGGHTSYTRGGSTIEITGRAFRERIMGFALRSASFTFSYDSGTDEFTFVTNGYGHGAGMSQNGANTLATHYGYSYVDILKHYYQGVEVR